MKKMSKTKVQVGYGTGGRGSNGKARYGKRRSGKVVYNGGFSNQPTVDFTSITQERWDEIFSK